MVARRRSIQSALAVNVREGFGATVLYLLISCGGGANGLEGSLPSGRWSGTWTETCSAPGLGEHVSTSAVEVSSLPNLRLDLWELRSINFTTFRKAIPNGSIRMETLWATVAARLVTATARQPSAGFKSNER